MSACGTADPRVPVHVLTGFLGSGKTTLLNRLLADEALARSAVIVNELGAIGIDHLLVERSDESLVELAGGCVCCAVRGDLAVTIADLLARRARGGCLPFDRIVIETTGLADPTPVLNLLVTDPLLAPAARAGTVIATVDAVNGEASLDRFPEAVKQAALADTIVLTKRDLAPAAERGLRARLARLNPRAAIVAAAHGGLPAGAAPFDASAPREDLAPAADTPHRHGEGIESFVLVRERPLAGAALALLVETLAEHAGADLLRVKGLVALAEAPDRPGVLHGAQHVFHPLDFLPAWPDADRRTRLVFITRGVPRDWVERLLDAIAWEVEETSRALATGGAARPPIETTLETTSCST